MSATGPSDNEQLRQQTQQNLLNIMRSRGDEGSVTAANASTEGLQEQEPQSHQQSSTSSPAEAHAMPPSSLSALLAQQRIEKQEANLSYLQNFAQLGSLREGLPKIQRAQLNPAVATALDQWYLNATKHSLQHSQISLPPATLQHFQPVEVHHALSEPDAPVSLKEWLEETDPVLDLRNVGDISSLEQRKRRKLVEDFESAEQSENWPENSEETSKLRDSDERMTKTSPHPTHSSTTPQRPPLRASVKPPLSVGSSSEYDPRSMSASIVAPPVELGPHLSKLYVMLKEQQKTGGDAHGMRELAAKSPRAVSKRIREVMNFEFELSQDEVREIQRGKTFGILDA